jgi:hypothetical protein
LASPPKMLWGFPWIELVAPSRASLASPPLNLHAQLNWRPVNIRIQPHVDLQIHGLFRAKDRVKHGRQGFSLVAEHLVGLELVRGPLKRTHHQRVGGHQARRVFAGYQRRLNYARSSRHQIFYLSFQGEGPMAGQP